MFLGVQLIVHQQCGVTASHYLNQWWRRLLTHIYATKPQWVMAVIYGSNRCFCWPYRIYANMLVKNMHYFVLNETLMPALSIRGGRYAIKYDKLQRAVLMLRSLDAYTAQSICGTLHRFCGTGAHFNNVFSLIIEILFWSDSFSIRRVLTNVSTYHNSIAPMSYAKFCSNHCVRIWIKVNWMFSQMWIVWKIVCEMGLWVK